MLKVRESQRIVVIGGGATGTELAVEIAAQFPEKEVTLIHNGQNFVNNKLSQKFQKKVKDILDRYSVKYKLGNTSIHSTY